MTRLSRRGVLQSSAAIGAFSIAGCLGDLVAEDIDYEIWAADQGTNTVYIYEPGEEDGDFGLVDEIDTGEVGGDVPHMVHFSSDYEYAAIACTAGGRTLVYRTEDRELVANLETGAVSHFAGFSPDDDAIIVDAIGTSEIVKVDADLDNEEFEIVDAIEINEEIDGLTEQEGSPVCHSYDHDGRSIHTLGPGYGNAGLVIVDHGDFEIDQAWSGDELPTNCGTIPHPSEDKFYLTAGLPSDPDEGVEGVGDFFVLDTDTDEILVDGEDTGGVDAHGFWFTPDGEELWVLNRETNDGIVIDPDTDEVVEDISAFGEAQGDEPDERDAPDIMWADPTGEYMFVTLRGPVPLSGDPHAATGVTPGFSVLDTDSKDIVTVVEPDPIDEYDEDEIQAARDGEEDAPAIPDFHGIGVRVVGDSDSLTSPPY